MRDEFTALVMLYINISADKTFSWILTGNPINAISMHPQTCILELWRKQSSQVKGPPNQAQSLQPPTSSQARKFQATLGDD